MFSESSELNRLLMARAYSAQGREVGEVSIPVLEEVSSVDDAVLVVTGEGKLGPFLVQCGVVVRISTVMEEK